MHSISSLALSAEKKTRQDTCETHGAFEAVNYIGKIWSRCPKCAEVLAELKEKTDELKKTDEEAGKIEAKQRKEETVQHFFHVLPLVPVV